MTDSDKTAMTKYFGAFDGTSKTWEDIEPMVSATFHKDCAITSVTNKGGTITSGYDDWASFLKNSLPRKPEIVVKEMKIVEGKGLEYDAELIYRGEPDTPAIPFASLAEFQDGKCMKIGPK